MQKATHVNDTHTKNEVKGEHHKKARMKIYILASHFDAR